MKRKKGDDELDERKFEKILKQLERQDKKREREGNQDDGRVDEVWAEMEDEAIRDKINGYVNNDEVMTTKAVMKAMPTIEGGQPWVLEIFTTKARITHIAAEREGGDGAYKHTHRLRPQGPEDAEVCASPHREDEAVACRPGLPLHQMVPISAPAAGASPRQGKAGRVAAASLRPGHLQAPGRRR